jgi:hypothetical protein
MSGIRSLTRRTEIAGYATDGSAPIYVDRDDNRVKLIPAGTGTTEVILQEAGGASSYETLITTRVLTAADSGKTFGLKLVGGFTVTLPAMSTGSGMNFKFVVEVAPTTAYIIITNAADLDKMAGQVYGADGVTSGAGSVVTFSADQLNFVASASAIADTADFYQVGTTGWVGRAFTALGATGATFTG